MPLVGMLGGIESGHLVSSLFLEEKPEDKLSGVVDATRHGCQLIHGEKLAVVVEEMNRGIGIHSEGEVRDGAENQSREKQTDLQMPAGERFPCQE